MLASAVTSAAAKRGRRIAANVMSAGDGTEGAQRRCRLEDTCSRVIALKPGEAEDAVALLVRRGPRVPVGALHDVTSAQQPVSACQARCHSAIGRRQRRESAG